MASVGFDAEVVKTVSMPWKRRIGRVAYVYAALKLAFCYKGGDIEVNTGDEIFSAKLVIATSQNIMEEDSYSIERQARFDQD
jgi:diacylglycerol kinase (ATP)